MRRFDGRPGGRCFVSSFLATSVVLTISVHFFFSLLFDLVLFRQFCGTTLLGPFFCVRLRALSPVSIFYSDAWTLTADLLDFLDDAGPLLGSPLSVPFLQLLFGWLRRICFLWVIGLWTLLRAWASLSLLRTLYVDVPELRSRRLNLSGSEKVVASGLALHLDFAWPGFGSHRTRTRTTPPSLMVAPVG